MYPEVPIFYAHAPTYRLYFMLYVTGRSDQIWLKAIIPVHSESNKTVIFSPWYSLDTYEIHLVVYVINTNQHDHITNTHLHVDLVRFNPKEFS